MELENAISSLEKELGQRIDPTQIGFYGYVTKNTGNASSYYMDGVNTGDGVAFIRPCKVKVYAAGSGYEGSSGGFYKQIRHANGATSSFSNNVWFDVAVGDKIEAGIRGAGTGTYKGMYYSLSGIAYPI